jgi:acyl-CoA dehydrogenase
MSVDPLLVETAERLLADVASFEAVEAAEAEGWSPAVWDPLAEAGFPLIGVAEAAGGSGGSLGDACAVLRAVGARAAPVPLAETGVLAGWLLAASGAEVADGPMSVGPLEASTVVPDAAGTVTGTLHRVPWGRSVARVVALVGGADGDWSVVAIDPTASGVRSETATNLAGEPRDTLHLAGVEPSVWVPAGPGVNPAVVELRGALSRAQLMAGALAAMSRLTVEYTNDRRQFGQPVARFQAVQAHLVHGAQDAAMALMAAEVAAREASRADAAGDLEAAWLEVACARVVAGEAAVSATRAAHQAHGAMGMTREYPLHHLSRRLWAWSREWGPTSRWRARVARAAHQAGAERLYPTITAGTPGLVAR